MPVARVVYGPGGSDYADFIRIEGQPQTQSKNSLVFGKPGVDGLGAVDVAKQGKPFTLLGVRDFADVGTAITSLQALKTNAEGEVCSVFDSGGNEFANLLCLEIEPLKPTPALLIVGGLTTNSEALGSVRMTFVHLGVSPE